MTQYIDKAAIIAEIEKIMDEEKESINSFEHHKNESEKQRYNARMALMEHILHFLDTLEVKEVNEELAETYMQVFEKKFPILPTLKGKQLDKFKNFLNRCRQIFGLQEFGIRPVQAKLFEKLALLWAAWGAENLQGIGQVEGEPDVVKEMGLEKELETLDNLLYDLDGVAVKGTSSYLTVEDVKDIAKRFFELGLKAQEGE